MPYMRAGRSARLEQARRLRWALLAAAVVAVVGGGARFALAHRHNGLPNYMSASLSRSEEARAAGGAGSAAAVADSSGR